MCISLENVTTHACMQQNVYDYWRKAYKWQSPAPNEEYLAKITFSGIIIFKSLNINIKEDTNDLKRNWIN